MSTGRRTVGPPMSRTHSDILAIYAGSNGDDTRTLYSDLERIGPVGVVAVNLFRASKTSERAKQYSGSRYKRASYETKQWSIDNLVMALSQHAEALRIRWGWAVDLKQEFHRWVLYVELPSMRGQVSFHTERRGDGPDYPDAWDGMKGVGPQRVCRWIADIFENSKVSA